MPPSDESVPPSQEGEASKKKGPTQEMKPTPKRPLIILVRFASLILTLIALGLSLQLSSKWVIRLDLTREHKYTLSNTLVKKLEHLKGPLQIDAFLPLSSPPPYKSVVAHTVDLLRDLKDNASTAIRVVVVDTAKERTEVERIALIERARGAHIPLHKLHGEEAGRHVSLEVPFGVSLSSLNTREVIPPLETIDEVESQIARAIQGLIDGGRRLKVGIAQGFGEPQLINSPLAKRLGAGRDLIAVRLDGESLIGVIDTLVILAPVRQYGERARWLIDQFMCHGGGVVMALDARQQSEVIPKVWVPSPSGLEPLLRAYGAEVEWSWVIADEEHPTPAALTRDAQGRVLLTDHPLYPKAVAQAHLITAPFKALTLPMAPRVQLPVDASPLLISHPSAVALHELRSLTLREAKEREMEAPYPMSFAVERVFESAFRAPPTPPSGLVDPPHLIQGRGRSRWVWIGSGRRLLSASPSGIRLLMNAIDWSLGEDELLSLKGRVSAPPETDSTAKEQGLIRWGTAVFPLLLFSLMTLFLRKSFR
jgi:ABC-type uncharacterized transport system involved in gliding motility auxiliary subunit